MKRWFLILVLFLVLGYNLSWAVDDYYPFATTQQQQRFADLTSQLRCLVCQNQTLAESNSPLAVDLRKQIYVKIQQHQSNDDIIHYLVARYGHYILYRPPLNMLTIGLWYGPFLFLVFSLGYLFLYLRKKSTSC